MLDQDVQDEMREFVDGIKATDNFFQVEIDVEKYVAQAIELFHSIGQDDETEIGNFIRQGLTNN